MMTVLRSHWRLAAAAVAVIAAFGLGAGTLASWSDSSDLPDVSVSTGVLDVTLVPDPVGTGAAVNWAVVDAEGNATRVDADTHYVSPGQHLRMTATWQVRARGDNYLAGLTFKNSSNGAPVDLDGAMASYIDQGSAVFGVLAGTVAPEADWGDPLVSVGLGVTPDPIRLTQDDDQSTYTTYLDIMVTDTISLSDLENQVLKVVNLDANLSQIRSGA